jgi:uncharacterized LabA/DUF88 family protein
MSSKSSSGPSSRSDERVMVFIDGSNLYHVLGENCGRHDLQFDKFCEKLANGRRLLRTYYYNVRQESERQPDVGRDQERFLASLYDSPYLEVRLGVWRQRGGEMVEKGVDVMLATDLVVKALKDQYDTAIVVSGDGDFFPAYQAAKDAGKHVEVMAFESNLSPEAARAADLTVKVTKSWFTGLWTTSRGARKEDAVEARAEAIPESKAVSAPERPRRGRPTRRTAPKEAPAPTERAQPEKPVPAPVSAKPERAAAAPGEPIRRTPARRRVGGTLPVNGHAGHAPAQGVEAPSERVVPAPPPLRPLTNGGEAAGQAAEPATPATESVEPGQTGPTRRRSGWLRRLGIPDDGTP